MYLLSVCWVIKNVNIHVTTSYAAQNLTLCQIKSCFTQKLIDIECGTNSYSVYILFDLILEREHRPALQVWSHHHNIRNDSEWGLYYFYFLTKTW